MAKQESTAINQLIDLVHRRTVEQDFGDDQLFVRRAALPGIAPLPRRRAPAATPLPDYSDNAETAVDPHPEWGATERVERYAFAPAADRRAHHLEPGRHPTRSAVSHVVLVQRLPPPLLAPQPIAPHPLDIYAESPDQRLLETMRVATLPASSLDGRSFGQQLRVALSRFAAPLGVMFVLMIFVSGYVMHAGQGGKKRVGAPAVIMHMTAEPPPQAATRAEEATIAQPEIEMPPENAQPARRSAKRHARMKPPRAAAPQIETRPTGHELERDPILAIVDKPAVPAAPKATGPGKLAVSSNVPALIYVDGRATRSMTPRVLDLPAGVHTVTLLEPRSRKARTTDIDVAAGKTINVSRDF